MCSTSSPAWWCSAWRSPPTRASRRRRVPEAIAVSTRHVERSPRGVSLKDSYTDGVRQAVVPLAGRLVSGGHVTPNALTVAGLVLNVATVPLILSGHFIWAAVVLLLAGCCDMLDGAVARLSEQVTPFGAFLDSTSDRLSEGVVLHRHRRLVRPSRPHLGPRRRCSSRS